MIAVKGILRLVILIICH